MKYLSIGGDCQLENIGEVIEIETRNNNSDALTCVIKVVGAWCSQYEGCTSCKTKVESQDGIVANVANRHDDEIFNMP